jgi:hypothetical protein
MIASNGVYLLKEPFPGSGCRTFYRDSDYVIYKCPNGNMKIFEKKK